MAGVATLLALVCFVLFSVVACSETDFWFEETRVANARQPEGKLEKRQQDVFDSITKDEQEEQRLEVVSEENGKPGPTAHVMLQAFDEDGDGLLDSGELGKINKKVRTLEV